MKRLQRERGRRNLQLSGPPIRTVERCCLFRKRVRTDLDNRKSYVCIETNVHESCEVLTNQFTVRRTASRMIGAGTEDGCCDAACEGSGTIGESRCLPLFDHKVTHVKSNPVLM